MPVTMQLPGAQVLEALGLDPKVTGWLDEQGIEAAVEFGALVFVQDGAMLAEVPVKLGVVKQLLNGEAPGLVRQTVREMVGKAVAAMQQSKVGAMAILAKPGSPVGLPGHGKPVVVLWPKISPKEMSTATPVKLRDATMMYQPVRGSSPGSRYFLIAANPDLRIAARYKGGSLSVRIEGPAWEPYQQQIAQCGFDNVSLSKGYASLHLAVPTLTIASKALGAILLGLGVKLETPLPDLKLIQDVGL